MEARAFRDKHLMRLPEVVIVGERLLQRLGAEIVEHMGAPGSLLLVTGPNVRKLVGGIVEESFKAAELKYSVIEVSDDKLATAERLARLNRADVIVGLGGGKVIDIAKYIAYKNRARFVSVPTSAAHDGIASPLASLKDLGRPKSLLTNPPKMIIADVDVIATSPPRLIRSGVGDLVSKLTAIKDWRLAHEEKGEYYGEYAAQLALLSAKIAMENSSSIGALERLGIRTLVEALISAGVAAGIAGSSRPCSGSEHLISHALDIVAPNKGLHGEKTGISSVVSAKLHGLRWESIIDALRRAKAPTSYSELGIDRNEVAEAIMLAPKIRPERYTILHKVKLTRREALDIIRELDLA